MTGIKTLFGYHAVLDKNRRTPPRSTTQSEDAELAKTDRKKMIATARENRRNQAILAWMIRKHIDNVATFTFQSQTGDRGFDREFESIMSWYSRPDNFDVAGRHGLSEFLRLVEGHRVVDGDVGILFSRNGKLQGIEGDRIATPTVGGIPKIDGRVIAESDVTHGVIPDKYGGARWYMVCDRDGQSLRFNRLVPARDMRMIGYYDRFDQIRGISPLSSAMNSISDLYEVMAYQVIKQKFQAMFGLAIKSDKVEASDPWNSIDADNGDSPDGSTSKYDFDLRPGLKLELAAGDGIDLIESKNPSNESQMFNKFLIHIGMLALDLPVTFFDASSANYSSMRHDLLEYYKSVERKRIQPLDFLNQMTAWKLARWAGPGGESALTLPRGKTMRDIKWAWLPPAFPWIDPLKEVTAYSSAVQNGFSSRQRIAALMGTDFWDTLDQLGDEEKAIIEKGVTVQVAQPGAIVTRDEELDNPADQQGVK